MTADSSGQSNAGTLAPSAAELPSANSGASGEAVAAQAPGWFKKRSRQAAQEPAANAGRQRRNVFRIVVANEEDEPLSFREQWRQCLRGGEGAAFGIAFLLHAIFLLILAVVVIDLDEDAPPMGLILSEAVDDPGEEYVEIGAVGIEIDEDENEFTQLPQTRLNDTVTDLTQPKLPAEPTLSSPKNVIRMPGKNAVVKGSFTAWTVPADPLPGQNYVIHVRINLPKGLKRYPSRDLRGSRVDGDDDYHQDIPGFYLKRYYPIKQNQAEIRIPVPGADDLVKDTIRIKSRILKEQQTLVIQF